MWRFTIEEDNYMGGTPPMELQTRTVVSTSSSPMVVVGKDDMPSEEGTGKKVVAYGRR